jgi:membrane associated rhomboid family serine protease
MSTTTLYCPRCVRAPLEKTLYEGRPVSLCRRCGGLWCLPSQWDKSRLGSVTTIIRHAERSSDEESPPHDVAPKSTHRFQGHRLCPNCYSPREPLIPWQAGGDAGIEFLRCDRCGGIWLEPGEWEQLETLQAMRQLERQNEEPTTWNDWAWQFFLGLPVEYNLPPRRYPYVTVGLILACVVIFCIQLFSPDLLVDEWGFRPAAAHGWGWLTLLSSIFMHGGLVHLVGNMYFLYVLGDNVEDALGHLGYLCFYLVCGMAADFSWYVFNSTSLEPCVGASGAIAGVMAAYFVLFRQARLTLMILFWQWKVRASFWLGLWFVFQLIAATDDISGKATGVAHLAHVGGFVAGLAIIWPLQDALMKYNPILRVLRLYRPNVATATST